jgi:hypothetical protein
VAFPDPGGFVLAFDWSAVVVALITLVGVVVNAVVAVYVARLVRTPSKQSIGSQVESAHTIAITNRHILTRLALALGVKADDPELREVLERAGDDAR